MENNDKPKRFSLSETRFMQFIGGKNLMFGLLMLIMIGLTLFIFEKVSYIFHPFVIIFNTIAAPVILGLILFYLLNPVIQFMERYNIPRLWGIIILFCFAAAVIALVVNLLIPVISVQIKSFAHNFPHYVEKFNGLVDQVTSWSHLAGMSDFYTQIQDQLDKIAKKVPTMVSDFFDGFGTKIMSIAEMVVNIGVVIVTTPFVLFFFLKDGHRIKSGMTKVMPPKYRQDFHEVLESMSLQVGSYIQGQIIVSFCIGILLFIGYTIIGLDYSLVLASIAAVTSVVPYLGPTIAISPAIIMALITSPIMLVKLIVVWTAVQFIEGHFISPNVMGKTLKIHPLTIIFVLLCAGNLLGIVGVILAIPGYAVIKVIVTHLFGMFKRRYNRYYGQDSGPYEVADDEWADNPNNQLK
ncbi:AI-2E family transporter [Staphylococcus simulans]|uniref:AI-2E family transporter n=1 Tax=Staphylococcus simulans TaxID=1286 RepID=UPI00399B9A90